MKKILVVGATGLQGKLIVKELLANDFSLSVKPINIHA